MKDIVLFDLDGTLLDSVPTIGRCCNAALKENGLPENPVPDYNRKVGRGMLRLIEQAVPAGTSKEKIDAVMASYDRIYTEACHTPGHIYPGVPDMLRELAARGIGTAVLSNKPENQCRAMHDSTFQGLLDVMWGHRDGYPHKPDPALALELVSMMDGRLIAYVGDSEVDLALAKNLGVPAVGVTWGTRTREELLAADPDCTVCDTAGELEEALLTFARAE